MKIRNLLFIGLGLVSLGFAVAQNKSLPVPSPSAVVGLSPFEAMALANAWGRAGAAVQSFVTPRAIEFKFDGDRKASVSLPKDQMVVAIAPYINRTHPCKTHFMSSCQGEMVKQAVKVNLQSSDGKTVFTGTVKTLENGFLELWLPRELNMVISLEAAGKKVSGWISTFDSSDTCITTLRLQ
jgi:hypothetical protein